MDFDGNTVRAVAALARLEISEPEVARFAGELSRVLEYVERLGPADQEAADPPGLLRRDDIVTSSPGIAGLVAVPKVVGGTE